MDADTFVAQVEKRVVANAIETLLNGMRKPSRVRKPDPGVKSLFEWFGRLSARDQALVELAIRKSAAYTMLNFLAILDGASTFEDGPERGDLELYYVTKERRVLLNSPKGPSLHEQLTMP